MADGRYAAGKRGRGATALGQPRADHAAGRPGNHRRSADRSTSQRLRRRRRLPRRSARPPSALRPHARACRRAGHRRYRAVPRRPAPACRRTKWSAITGTNGKSTTTALVHHHRAMPQTCPTDDGRQYRPAGARPARRCPRAASMCWSCSSYQIDLTYSLEADVAAFINSQPRSPRPL